MGEIVDFPKPRRDPGAFRLVSVSGPSPHLDPIVSYLGPLVADRGENVDAYRTQVLNSMAIGYLLESEGGMHAAGLARIVGDEYHALYCRGSVMDWWLPLVARAVSEQMDHFALTRFVWWGRPGWMRILRKSILAKYELSYRGIGQWAEAHQIK